MKKTAGFPLYVKLGLLGIRTRKGALVQFWTSIAIAVALLLLGLFSNSLLWTSVFCAAVLLTAGWYWNCIRWVDAHGKWEERIDQGPRP